MSTTVICQMCGKEIQAGNKGRMYCQGCMRMRRRAHNATWRQKHGKEYRSLQRQRALQHLQQQPTLEPWKRSLDLFMQRLEAYNQSCKLSGRPELSYGYYVAQFDGPKENAAPSAGTPESGK